VVYKANAISIAIARRLVKIKFISLVNLIMDKAVVKELIQEDCNSRTLTDELNLILHNPVYRSQMLIDYQQLAEKMGEPGASQKTAGLIFKALKN
jgi:lipid-A-disaccharide synthase